MKEELAKALIDGLYGKQIHPHPLKSLNGLTFQEAADRISKNAHSSYDLLFHIVFWQDLVLEAMHGEKVEWPKKPNEDWPDSTSKTDWDALVQRFEEGLEEGKRILKEGDFERPLPSWRNIPMLRAAIVLAQHNSYHLGQIVANRIAHGSWPPPEKE
ncbi:MAG: DinB family protein [Candidatus Thorarchaeota archaeon]